MFVPLAVSQNRVQPYASIGAGINLINYRQYLGEFSDVSSSAAFTAKGEAGVTIIVGKHSGSSLQLGANYNYTFYSKNGLTSLNAVGLNTGIMFPLK